ncbi:RagB/SusD family nutrient uptake outer membrane protein [Sphingobacterium shayense]|uniref:RagB/SusD family nutrient uptake outer membrane protein n=1 Tax=Sphingobacterium shayense TaxID=626343 RepID=UPI0015528236|nr:RagB/SusD family nutrient uptake outer membrane protein [Sphingobacterium shayense]NQD72188.1 RagB/SusD family nutrient uptake outer membrane protein [Sphingobacterium shayense]
MKKLNRHIKTRLFYILGLGLLFTACEKSLIEAPKQIAVENFYTTPSEVEAAVNAIYTPLRNGLMSNYIATLECQSDWMYGRGSWTPLSNFQGLDDANITRVEGFWNNFYLTIRNANLVVLNSPAGEEYESLVAEAKFLRAFSYFQLVRNWGGVPLRTEGTMTEKDLPRSTEEEVYRLIEEDLNVAADMLPENASVSGRPTKWAAKTLLSDVYLQLEQYAKAAEQSQQVMQNSFSLVSVSTKEDFQYKIFGPDIVSSSEEIFALKYARLPDQGNYILWIANHPSTKLFTTDGTGAYAVHGDATNANYLEWNDQDLRKQLWDKINFGLGPNTLVSSKYIDPDALDRGTAGNDLPIYRLSDVLLIYAEASSRANNAVSSESMEALNKVHRRAYGFAAEATSPVDFDVADYTVDTFIDLIVKERGYEFIYEGKRWLELKRIGEVNEYIAYGKGKTVIEKHLLWPIPLSETNYNNAIDPVADQNSGY